MTANRLRKFMFEERGSGFMESLIAILIAGIACTALLSVAVGVIREAKNNEIRDALTTYAVQGFEEVRVLAAGDYDQFICAAGTHYAKIYKDGITIIPVTELCSRIGGGDGECERLPMPGETEAFFYREIEFTGVGGSCNRQRVVVTVGMLENAGVSPVDDSKEDANVEDQEDVDTTAPERAYPRNFVTETSIVGYIAR